jgi:hypothetical protein
LQQHILVVDDDPDIRELISDYLSGVGHAVATAADAAAMRACVQTPVPDVVLLEVGADDYIGKPFDPRELHARIKGVLRRYQRASVEAPAPTASDKRVALGRCTLSLVSRQLFDPAMELRRAAHPAHQRRLRACVRGRARGHDPAAGGKPERVAAGAVLGRDRNTRGNATMNRRIRSAVAAALIMATGLLFACTSGGGSGSPPPATLPTPTGLTATAVSASEIDLAWNIVPGALAYVVYRDGQSVATVAGNDYLDTGLFAGTTFSYQVAAQDNASALSALSSAASAPPARPCSPPSSRSRRRTRSSRIPRSRSQIRALSSMAGCTPSTR